MNGPIEFEAARTSWRSMALSGIMHGALLAACVAFWRTETIELPSEKVRAVELRLTDVSNTSATEILERLPTVTENFPADSGDVRKLLPLSQAAPSTAVVATPQVLTPMESANLNAGAMTQPVGNSGFAVAGGGPLTAKELEQIAAERLRIEGERPRGEPATIGVFGSGGLTGRKFVFVIDRSKSMGDEGLGVLARANGELQSALARLTSDHQFQVVAYNHETAVIERRALLSVTDENRKKVTEFIQNLASFGGTEHESGIIAALAFKPDVVVLLTDGGLPEMNEAQLATIRRIAGKKSQVHCIQFGLGPATTDSFMIPLAQQNNGTYTYIDVRKWK